jgi:hypothetical protein
VTCALLALACSSPEVGPDGAVWCRLGLEFDGAILEVDPRRGIVAIALGENEAEVGKGWRLAVHDGRYYKGEVRITDVIAGIAIGQIEFRRPGQTILKGDTATTRLR